MNLKRPHKRLKEANNNKKMMIFTQSYWRQWQPGCASNNGIYYWRMTDYRLLMNFNLKWAENKFNKLIDYNNFHIFHHWIAWPLQSKIFIIEKSVEIKMNFQNLCKTFFQKLNLILKLSCDLDLLWNKSLFLIEIFDKINDFYVKLLSFDD